MLIDDFADPDLVSRLGTPWRAVSDRVMGGVSRARVARETAEGRPCLHLSGDVRLENNGGFIQAALDLAPTGAMFDATGFTGLRLTARGNGETYAVHLRTSDARHPWQSYRAPFSAADRWSRILLPFTGFKPHRLTAALDNRRLRRLGLVAIGRAFAADLMVCELALY